MCSTNRNTTRRVWCRIFISIRWVGSCSHQSSLFQVRLHACIYLIFMKQASACMHSAVYVSDTTTTAMHAERLVMDCVAWLGCKEDLVGLRTRSESTQGFGRLIIPASARPAGGGCCGRSLEGNQPPARRTAPCSFPARNGRPTGSSFLLSSVR